MSEKNVEANMDFTLQIDNVSKRYGKVLAVDGLGIELAAGELFGFIGPNARVRGPLFIKSSIGLHLSKETTSSKSLGSIFSASSIALIKL